MDPERERIQADLRGLIDGEVRCDDLFVQLYANDASIFEIRPLGVVRPRHTEDVVTCVRYAAENQIPLHARGAGTGLAGESLGPGLVIDFSRYMRRILNTEEDRVRLQPGVIHQDLNRHLAPRGRQFGPDPATSHVTTMGGVISVDSSGSHWLKYGSARRHVESLQIVMADGQLLEVGRESINSKAGSEQDRPRKQLVSQVADLLDRRAHLISEGQSGSLVNHAGYLLHGLRDGKHLDLARLIAGSQGTLALITEATVATQLLPKHRGVVLLLFDRLESASKAVQEILPLEPSACDLMDRRHLSLARESDVRYDLLIPQESEAVLLVEQEGETVDEVRDRLAQVVDRVRKRRKLAFGAQTALDAEDIELYWQLARKFVPTLYRLRGSRRPLPFIEDIAVPPESLPSFFVDLHNTLKQHQITASIFGHVGHGQLHVRPFLDLADPESFEQLQRLAADLYEKVIRIGGSISGEHGDGLSRTPFLRQQYGLLYDVFAEVKNIFDPQAILNPGKVVGEPAAPIERSLRPVAARFEQDVSSTVFLHPGPLEEEKAKAEETIAEKADADDAPEPPVVPLQLVWNDETLTHAARACNGCGTCRSQGPDVRMCPINRFAPSEEASPRAKANMVRSVLTGRLDSDMPLREDFKQIVDLCVHCHQCRLECPASVDIPKLMIEAKAAYVGTNGLRMRDMFMTRVETLSAWAGKLPGLANWAIRNRQSRWLIEKLLGIAQGRKLPRLAKRNFLSVAARMRLTRATRESGAKVLYFVDSYANYHDVQLAEALLRVFDHNGVAVYVHPGQKPSGMPLVSQGAVEQAKVVAAHNVNLLSEAVRQGYRIVASEPSAVLCLTREYPQLLDDDDAQLVADNTQEACHYLWGMHLQGKLKLDFKPTEANLGYHMPCHLKALDIGAPGENLLRLIPGLAATRIEKGCSGMAGTFGLKKENYRNSLRAGWDLISALRDAPIQAGVTECCSCKMQMEQGTSKPTLHPIKVLALAYGLMPEVASLLRTPGEELVVT